MDDRESVDRGWAWGVLMASFGILVFVGSTMYGTGVIHLFLLETFGEDPVKTSWVGSLSSSFSSLVGPVAGFIASRWNCRTAIILGGLLCLIGFSASALVQSFDLLFLTYGTLAGIGTGLAYTPAVVVLGYYFDKKRDLACGLAVAGCGIGMMAGPLSIRWLTEIFGWRGMFLLLGGLNFHICLLGALCFPNSVELEQKRLRELCKSETKSHLKDHFAIFTNVSFLFFLASIILYSFGCSAIFLHFPNYCKSKGATTDEVTLLLTVTSLCSIVSRILTGMGAGNEPANKYLFYFGSYGITALAVLLFPLYSDTVTGRYAFAALFGFYTTVNYVVLNPITIELVGLFDLSMAYGVEMLVCGIGFLMGPPIAAAIVQGVGDYSATLYFTGAVMMVSSVFGMLVMVFKQPVETIIEDTEITIHGKGSVLALGPADLLRSLTSLPGIFGTSKENLSLSVLSLAHRYPSILTLHDTREHCSRITLSKRHSITSEDNEISVSLR